MNNQNLMMQKKPGQGLPEYEEKPAAGGFVPVHNNGMGMIRRDAVVPGPGGTRAVLEPEEKTVGTGAPDGVQEQAAPEKQIAGAASPAKPPAGKPPAQQRVGASKDELAAKTAAIKEKAAAASRQAAANAGAKPPQPSGPAPGRQTAGTKPAAGPAASVPASIKSGAGPDEMAQAYIRMFKSSLGLDLSSAIVFENMRKICEPDVRDPLKTLYFLENTYRVSTLLYLAGNLPILVVTSILAEKNRKNILKYVTIEVENGNKPYDQLRELRMKRWVRKFENMAVNDAMTVTPGVSVPTKELADAMAYEFGSVSSKLKKFDAEMTGIVAKFDDATRNDVVYIYSNWWYLLQGFENVPEMRSYVMAITDDTRRNLKI